MPTKEELLKKQFGEEFAKKYEEHAQEERQKQLRRLTAEEKAEVLEVTKTMDPAVGKALWGERDVLLVEVPNKVTRRVLSSGAVSTPLIWTGRWVSCLFNNVEVVEDLIEGDLAFAVGKFTEKEVEGVTYPNMRVIDIVKME